MSNHVIQDKMKGIVVALAVGFDSESNIVFEPIKKHIDACIEEGIHGFWVNGATGMCVYLEESERKELTELASEHIAGRVPMWVHVGAMNTKQACRLAVHAREHGAIGISALPPLFYNTTLDRIVDYLTEIQKAADLPMTYYHALGATRVALSADDFVQLCERVPNLTAIKYSETDFFKAVVLRERLPHVRIMTGFEEIVLAGLAMGCFDGTVGGGQNFVPGPLVDVYNAYQQGDFDRALVIHRKIARLLDIHGQFDFTAGTYAFLNLLGFKVGRPRSPMQYLSDSEHEQMRELALKVIKPDPFEQQRLIRTTDFLTL